MARTKPILPEAASKRKPESEPCRSAAGHTPKASPNRVRLGVPWPLAGPVVVVEVSRFETRAALYRYAVRITSNPVGDGSLRVLVSGGRWRLDKLTRTTGGFVLIAGACSTFVVNGDSSLPPKLYRWSLEEAISVVGKVATEDEQSYRREERKRNDW